MTEVLRVLAGSDEGPGSLKVTPEALGRIIALVENKILNFPKAKDVFAVLVEEGGDPEELVRARGWAQVSDSSEIEPIVEGVIAAHPGPVADFRNGKAAALQFLTGQVMRLSKGKANPQIVQELLKVKLAQG
jgi:aspartyl-tRNA(Asn)/glutamyl-tRNA(Gln) amidotransferase subunit B